MPPSPQNRELFQIQTRLNPPPEVLVQLFAGRGWHLILERLPQASDAPALPWEELLQTTWLKMIQMPKSRQIGKRHLKVTDNSKAADPAKRVIGHCKASNPICFEANWFRGTRESPTPEAPIPDLYPQPPSSESHSAFLV